MNSQELIAPILVRMQSKSNRCSPRRLIEDIKENLSRLLNSRLPMPTDYVLRSLSSELLEYVDDSMVNYGIADIFSMNLGDETMDSRFCKSVRLAVNRFEPRVKNVQVELVSTKERFVTIRLIGQLRIPPYSEIELESGVMPASSNFSMVD